MEWATQGEKEMLGRLGCYGRSKVSAHGRFSFRKSFLILQNLYPFANHFEVKPNLNFEQF
jgi:hypothetical protein